MQANIPEPIEPIESRTEVQSLFSPCGTPIPKTAAHDGASAQKRIGSAKGWLKSPDDFDLYNEEVARLFTIAE